MAFFRYVGGAVSALSICLCAIVTFYVCLCSIISAVCLGWHCVVVAFDLCDVFYIMVVKTYLVIDWLVVVVAFFMCLSDVISAWCLG